MSGDPVMPQFQTSTSADSKRRNSNSYRTSRPSNRTKRDHFADPTHENPYPGKPYDNFDTWEDEFGYETQENDNRQGEKEVSVHF